MDKLGLFVRLVIIFGLGICYFGVYSLDKQLVSVQKQVSHLDLLVSILEKQPKRGVSDDQSMSDRVSVRDVFVIQRF